MGRLIDADELFVKWQTTMMKMDEPVSAMFILAAMSDLQQAPTVEAIPVEWIENYISKTNDTTGYAVAEMLSDWEAERDGE